MGRIAKITDGEIREIKYQILDLFWAMTNVVDNWTDGVEEQLEHQWVFVETSRGKRVPHIVTNNRTLQEMDVSVLAREISVYIKSLDPLASQRKWSTRTIGDCANFIVMSSRITLKLESVARIAWLDEPVWTFARLPFNRAMVVGDPVATMVDACPVFSEFISRFDSTKQAIAFCAWVGSLILDRENKIHRGVILYGEGRNGKSTFLNFLRRLFDSSMIYKNCGTKDSFKTDGMERARILAFADVNNRDLFVDALIKGLIGGDNIEINAKKERQFQSRPLAKVIACTNMMPNIKDNVAEKRRWVFCSVAAFAGQSDAMYQQKLDSESELVMACCCEIFEQNIQGNDFPVDEECLAVVTDSAEFDVSYFCDLHFVRDKDAAPFPSRNIAALRTVTKSKLSHERIIKYLIKHYGATCGLKRIFGHDIPMRCTEGIAIRPTSKMLINMADNAETE